MPGIYGWAGRPEVADMVSRLDEMAASMRHHPWYTEHRYRDLEAGVALGRTDLGLIHQDKQPAQGRGGRILTILSGEVLDFQQAARALGDEGGRRCNASSAELVTQGYLRSGRAFLRALRGSFVGAIWDARCRRLILFNDRLGMKPLYYAHTPDRLIFGSEIKALLVDPAVSRSLNPRGIAQFFTFGQLLNEDTFYAAVRALPAGAWLEYEADTGRLTVDRYWHRDAEDGTRHLDQNAALERLDQAFGAAVQRSLAGGHRLGLSLSGGMDSRTILAAASAAGARVTTVSLGMPGSIDTRCAERMAALVGSNHYQHRLDHSFLDHFHEHLRQSVHLTDGHYLCQCIVMPTLPLYRELGIDVLLRGHGGELMHMDKAYNFSLDRDALAISDDTALQTWLFNHLRAFILQSLPGPLFLGELELDREALALSSLRDGLAGSRGMSRPVNRIADFFLTQRLRREMGLSMVQFNSVVEPRNPFLDEELIDVLFQIPPELKCGETIQAYLLRSRCPQFLRVPNANTGARVGAGRLARVASRARLKIMAKLGAPGFQPYERLGLWLRRELRCVVDDVLLSDRCRDRGIFNPATVASIVRDHWEGRSNHTYLLLAMMIFEQSQREFVDADGINPSVLSNRQYTASMPTERCEPELNNAR